MTQTKGTSCFQKVTGWAVDAAFITSVGFLLFSVLTGTFTLWYPALVIVTGLGEVVIKATFKPVGEGRTSNEDWINYKRADGGKW